jgi:hypothetical protein
MVTICFNYMIQVTRFCAFITNQISVYFVHGFFYSTCWKLSLEICVELKHISKFRNSSPKRRGRKERGTAVNLALTIFSNLQNHKVLA